MISYDLRGNFRHEFTLLYTTVNQTAEGSVYFSVMVKQHAGVYLNDIDKRNIIQVSKDT